MSGVALRDQVVTFDITAREAQAGNAAQRRRFAALAATFDDGQWTAASRCSQWNVQDVVRHVTQMCGVTLATLRSAQAGERYEGFAGFAPKVSPHRLVRDAGPEPVERTAYAFSAAVDEVVATVSALDPDDTTLLVMTPPGRQPWPRATLHSLFDSAVHERDVALPLGLPSEPGADELTAIAAYQVLLAARVACLFGSPFTAELHLDGATPMTVAIDGPAVSVARQTGTGSVVAHGSATAVLDAMTGRGALDAVLDAPGDVIAGLASISAMI